MFHWSRRKKSVCLVREGRDLYAASAPPVRVTVLGLCVRQAKLASGLSLIHI